MFHRLRSDGHEVLYVAEMDPGIDDERVLTIANERNALLLTADKDFGELVYRNRSAELSMLLRQGQTYTLDTVKSVGLTPSLWAFTAGSL